MKVILAGHLEQVSGAHGSLVYCALKNGETIARRRPQRSNADSTPEQDLARSQLASAAQFWKHLSVVQRKAWTAYATRYYLKSADGSRVVPRGAMMFNRANIVRQVLGLPFITEAPTDAPPKGVLTYEQVPGQPPSTLRFRVYHSLPSTEGLMILAKMTRPVSRETILPQYLQMSYVCGPKPQSAAPVPPDGGEIVYNNIRYPMQDGERYVIEARLVRVADGLTGTSPWMQFLKNESIEPERND